MHNAMMSAYNQNVAANRFSYRMSLHNDQAGIRARIRRLISDKTNGRKQDFAAMIGIQASMLSRLISEEDPVFVTRRFLIKIEQGTGARLMWLENGLEPIYYQNGRAPYRSETEHYEGNLLRAYLERIGMGQKEFGDRLGKTKSTVNGYFKTESFSTKNKESILAALDATEEQVFGFNASTYIPANPTETTNAQNARLIRHVGNFSGEPIAVLPFVPIRARAGLPTTAYWQQPRETTRIMRASLADYEPDPNRPRRSWWVIEIDGDSMEPQLRSRARGLGYYIGREGKEGIFELDREQLRTLRPGIWAIQYDDEFVIKRIRANNIESEGGLLAHSDNPPPDPFFIHADSIRHVWFMETVVSSPIR